MKQLIWVLSLQKLGNHQAIVNYEHVGFLATFYLTFSLIFDMIIQSFHGLV